MEAQFADGLTLVVVIGTACIKVAWLPPLRISEQKNRNVMLKRDLSTLPFSGKHEALFLLFTECITVGDCGVYYIHV